MTGDASLGAVALVSNGTILVLPAPGREPLSIAVRVPVSALRSLWLSAVLCVLCVLCVVDSFVGSCKGATLTFAFVRGNDEVVRVGEASLWSNWEGEPRDGSRDVDGEPFADVCSAFDGDFTAFSEGA